MGDFGEGGGGGSVGVLVGIRWYTFVINKYTVRLSLGISGLECVRYITTREYCMKFIVKLLLPILLSDVVVGQRYTDDCALSNIVNTFMPVGINSGYAILGCDFIKQNKIQICANMDAWFIAKGSNGTTYCKLDGSGYGCNFVMIPNTTAGNFFHCTANSTSSPTRFPTSFPSKLPSLLPTMSTPSPSVRPSIGTMSPTLHPTYYPLHRYALIGAQSSDVILAEYSINQVTGITVAVALQRPAWKVLGNIPVGGVLAGGLRIYGAPVETTVGGVLRYATWEVLHDIPDFTGSISMFDKWLVDASTNRFTGLILHNSSGWKEVFTVGEGGALWTRFKSIHPTSVDAYIPGISDVFRCMDVFA